LKVKRSRQLLIGLGALLVLALGVGLAFASDAAPTQEPVASPFFEATLQQAVDELDGKAKPASAHQALQPEPTRHYTTDTYLWPECQFGYTRDLVQWPSCHYTSDPNIAGCDADWPTKDYTWDTSIWPECDPTGGPNITQDPTAFWCDSTWTHDPAWGPLCANPNYTRDVASWRWCNPRYTTDPAIWPWCYTPTYTMEPQQWPECAIEPTSDPYVWPECHYTSDPQNSTCIISYPTQDYTSNAEVWPGCPVQDPEYTYNSYYWPWCDRAYTTNPSQWPECASAAYTQDPLIWWWCRSDPNYTNNAYRWPECHFTSDPVWTQCQTSYPTKDYTQDANIWPECGDPGYTQSPSIWPWCDPTEYTSVPDVWPWCAPNWTWDPQEWVECQPGYTNDPDIWTECGGDPYTLYTQDPQTWPECDYYTADSRIWPECHYTSDPSSVNCNDNPFPTKDYTTDITLWPECDVPPGYTSDPQTWPECHYTSDPTTWPECPSEVEVGDLGDAPDSTNHFTPTMTAYPAGGPPGTLAGFPSVFDPATGLPQGPKHWNPRADAWLGPWVTLENDADQPPDEDGVINIIPPLDTPNRDGADDGLLYPVNLPDCTLTVISYTVTVTPGGSTRPRYVNVWFDWNRDGDWQDVFTCAGGLSASEWAVQDQVINVGPGTHVLQTPWLLPYNPTPDDPLWMRITLSEQPAPVIVGTNMADGQGPANGYQYGETEDYYLWSEPEPDYDIYIKDNSTDDGSVPSSSPWWVSPDIWVRNNVADDCAVETTHQNPIPGMLNKVCIRVRNRMTTTVDNITVNAYWANAALSLTWPASWSFINSFNIPSLAGGAEVIRAVAWNVPFITGHFCLLARADAPNDPIGSGPDTIAPVDSVQNNNNIAQKNTNVVDYPEITTCGFYTTTVYTDVVYFDAVNTWNQTVTVDIEIDSADFPVGSGTMIVEPGSLWGRWTTLTNFNQIMHTLEPTALPATMGGIQMSPFETARMTMTIAAEIDERFTIDVTEYVSGTDAGGIQYVRNLPHCIYLPLISKNWSP
jgi:hypothetical protein